MTDYVNKAVRALIGRWSPLLRAPHPVEASEVRRFSHATMDDAPRYREAVAFGRDLGGPVAPPGFAVHAFRREADAADPLDRMRTDPDFDGVGKSLRPGLPELDIPLPRLLNGGYEYEIFQYFRIGQQIFRKSRYQDIYQKNSKGGAMVFVVIDDIYLDRDGQTYLKSRNTLILR